MKKRKYLILGIFLVIGFLIFNKTLSKLKPIPKVTFKSQKLNYDKKEPGSFKVDKSAKWIGEGKAKVTIDVESIIKEKYSSKDIVFVLDTSSSVGGATLNHIKQNIHEIVNDYMQNKQNRLALISFSSTAKKELDFTNNKLEFNHKLDSLDAKGESNYKAGLEEVKHLLEGYKQVKDKELLVLFLTGSYPTVDTPGEVAIYKEIKHNYPYANVNAVIYDFWGTNSDKLEAMSDKQFYADSSRVHNVLFEAGKNPLFYDKFVITDILGNSFISDKTKINVNQGKATIDGDKIVWDLGSYSTGKKASMDIELEQTGSKESFYKTNKGIEILTSFAKQKDNQISSKTPVLKHSYKVVYEANAPKGCNIKVREEDKYYRPYNKVKLVKDNLECQGYLFHGYKSTNNLNYINNDYITMPEEDVVFKAVWSKIKVNKRMNGKISTAMTVFDKIKSESLGNDKDLGLDYSKGNSSANGEGIYLLNDTKNDKYPVYFYRGTHNLNNNIIYANFCWKIIRTTENAGVRIIYNGSPINGKCTIVTGEETQAGYSSFNSGNRHKKYVGYMYGDDTNPYQNKNDSDIKKYIDNWYKNNIQDKGYAKFLDKKSIYCGDRTEGSNQGSMFIYAARERLEKNKPSLKCPLNDSYSVEAGNRSLKYPISLVTSDEANLAGVFGFQNNNDNHYLYNGMYYWLNTPSYAYDSGYVDVLHLGSTGRISSYGYPTGYAGVRPVVTLDNSIQIISGNGLQEDPYII